MKRREFLVTSATLAMPLVIPNAVPSLAQALSPQTPAAPRPLATGPLHKHPTNSRYLANREGRAVLLTGSHTWNNLVDFGTTDPPASFDFPAYLDFLDRYHHNFIRLWTWETTTWDTRGVSWATTGAMNRVEPHPWSRSGPGSALDGKPKFDLEKFDANYFRRLRERVVAAGARGIYVSIMLFEGWALQFADKAWESHPMHPANNINGVGDSGTPEGRGLRVHELDNPEITRLQEAYIRHVVDTVNDLDNVLYEISNENHPASTPWQYHLIDYLHQYERSKPCQHPVGMTFQYEGGSNQTLMDSPADWISPNAVGGYRDDPPASDGRKVILSDTDHLWGIGGNASWVWKSFLRGLNPLFMDPYDGSLLGKRFDSQWEPIRRSLGYTLQLATSLDLASLQPHIELASTRYCLAQPGHEYLIYFPEGGDATVDLSALKGTAIVRWMDTENGTLHDAQPIDGGKSVAFQAPSPSQTLLHIKTQLP